MATDREQVVAANRARLLAADAPSPLVSPDVADGLLRSAVCGRCGYDLTGLPTAAADAPVCPECGRAAGPDEVILYGYAADRDPASRTARPPSRRQVAWRWAWSVPVLAVAAWTWPMRRYFGVMYGSVASVALGLLAVTWRGARRDTTHDALQVRLTPAGVGEVVRGLGPLPYDRVDRARVTPWRRFTSTRVTPEPDGLVRVTLTADDDFWTFRPRTVDAVVHLPADAVPALRQRISEWRATAARR